MQSARYRAARCYAGLTQEELADKLGVEVQTVKRREAGKEAKRLELLAVASICNVPIEWLEQGWHAIGQGDTLTRLDEVLERNTHTLNEILAKLATEEMAESAEALADPPEPDAEQPPASDEDEEDPGSAETG